MLQKISRILIVIAWLFFIFILSNIPDEDFGPPLFSWQGLVAHLIIYAVLAYLLLRAILSWAKTKSVNWQTVFGIIAFCLFYGITDEYHQSYVIGRSASLIDLGFDGLGGAVGAVLFWLKKQR
ncbi:teicoplanin resistance protein VanZ [Candidatus Falkowbacteria bacterium CG10_big_fil_rev_8_21_14_0_10_38_22]|uniref:Teicoplanin resistance protein VanZ n=2 Tax=Candidatus Falkowiibacteriota TaxID=1752728 RepID=A0A2M6WQE6_9BACT|nr:MAG: teicoplanin resistance protein VanZ [Candidatus Falkowbacteria bacterium CG10_big_fil_rev_8_21_14_0_10_38_22]